METLLAFPEKQPAAAAALYPGFMIGMVGVTC